MVKPNFKKVSKDVEQDNFDSKNAEGQRDSVNGEPSIVETKFPVKIAKIGIKTVDPSESDGSFRSFQNQRYRMLFPDRVVEGSFGFGLKLPFFILDLNNGISFTHIQIFTWFPNSALIVSPN